MTSITVHETLIKRYFEEDPIKTARLLETMSEEEVAEALMGLPSVLCAGVIRHLNDAFVAAILNHLPQEQFSAIVDLLDSQRGANILIRLPEDLRQVLLGRLDKKKKNDIEELLTFPRNSAGSIMSKDIIAVHGDIRVKDAVQKIRELAHKNVQQFYVYVVDEDQKFVGVLNMRDLLLTSEDMQINKVMRSNPFKVDSFMDREQVASELTSRRFFAAPVVDQDGRLLGVVKSDKIITDVQEEASEDMQKMFGAGGSERASSSLSFSLKRRLPWLHVNLLTAFLAAGVVALFQDVIAEIAVLAVFLPVVAGQGGNAGAQSLAVVMRGIVMREIPVNKVRGLLVKETVLGGINGIVIGSITALLAWWWKGNPYLGLVIGLGMIVNLTVAGLAGAAIPLGMKKVGLDPAQCSSIILTTITDVVGFFAFLGFAVLFRQFLI
ncbi:MAG: magnesium transporter [Candidatus Omnitrophota bacterium]|jgi:magnesium transporter